MDFDTKVKLKIYQMVARETVMPAASEVAAQLSVPAGEVQAAFKRLYRKRLLVPEPGDETRIRMAPPFSGVATPFRVEVSAKSYYANCVWDAFGVPAALHADATIHASDGFTGEPLLLQVKDGKPGQRDWVAHFAVPAAQWWRDIIYT
jgi:hypothetical protein